MTRALAAAGLLALAAGAAAAPGAVVRVEHVDPSTAPTRGPTSALVTIELFFAPTTNAAIRLPSFRQLEKLQDRHPTRIRIIYRIMRRNGQGPQLPAVALDAHAQGKFFELMAELHTQRSNLNRDQIIGLGKKIGLDTQRLEAAIKDDRYRDVLDGNERRFDRMHGINAPNVLLNGKVPRGSLGAMQDSDWEREYTDAYDRALELIDRGVDPRALGQAFDDQALSTAQPFVVSGSAQDDPEGDPTAHPLAAPPLQLAGLPSFGKPDAAAPVPLVVLCRPNDNTCTATLRVVRRLQEIFADDIRVVWMPFFDVTRDDATDLAMLGDAALCAEQIGSSPDDLSASPGWRWLTAQLEHARGAHGRRVPAEKLIDAVATELDVDSAKLSACRARVANTALGLVAAARKSGVSRAPAVVIGGRIYEGLSDQNLLQQLIEAELAPGVLGTVAPAWRPPSSSK